MAKIVVLSGSPRKGGNTDCLVEAFVKGASLHSDNEITIIRVCEKKIHPCIGCNACVKESGNLCIQNDDMNEIYKELLRNDVLIIASPVYFYGISAQLKAVVDRCHTPIRNQFKIRKIGLFLVGAATISDLFDPILLQFNMINRFFHLEDIGHVCVSGVKEKREIETLAADQLEKAYKMGASLN